MPAPDLTAAADAVERAAAVVDAGTKTFRPAADPTSTRSSAYDLAHAAAAVETARAMLDYGAQGDTRGRRSPVPSWPTPSVSWPAGCSAGRPPGASSPGRSTAPALSAPPTATPRSSPPRRQAGPRHLDDDFELVQDTFRRFADEKLKPIAEHIHRHNDDIPEDVISGLGEMGAFGLSIPEEYGGYGSGGESEYIGMVVATEELSRAASAPAARSSPGPRSSPVPWSPAAPRSRSTSGCPKLATAEVMNAVAVTEPDFGCDSANVTASATRTDGGWLINGVKTWCTFGARADVLMLLARTDPDRPKPPGAVAVHRPKQRGDGHGFELAQDGGGKMEGRADRHDRLPGHALLRDRLRLLVRRGRQPRRRRRGQGKGFYFQMAGFENGRLQTAARAVGVMQAAYEAAKQYAVDRIVFGRPVGEYQLTQAKLARMAMIIQAARQASYAVARQMAKGQGTLEAAMVKAYVCKAAEWVTREAMQIHGGMGYAEEYDVSRYFVDARVLSIFEGADETLCLKVIARRMVERVED